MITPDTSAWLREAAAHHQAGRLKDAAAKYKQILAIVPDHFDALHFSGVIARQEGKLEVAIELLERATDLQPFAYPAFDSLGLAFQAAGRLDRAEQSFRQAIALNPDFVQAHENLGRLLYSDRRYEEAADAFRSVALLLPDSPAAQNNLGTVLGSLRRYDEARRCYERALSLDPAFADASLNLAELLVLLGRAEDAEKRYLAVLESEPNNANVHYKLGYLLYKEGRREDALQAFSRALALDADFVEARWALAMSELPLAYGPEEDPATFRVRFSDALGDLERWFTGTREELGYRAVGNQQPFYLAFHNVDNLELLTQYGDLCARLMRRWQEGVAVRPRQRPRNRKIRIGMISGFFYDQSVWTAIVRGWCTNLDPDRFELHLMYTGIIFDAETEIAKAHAAYFHCGHSDLAEWVRVIGEQNLDVIVFPEIGMDRMTAKLASLRLAPVQVAAWGHPETTGLPTIDYYLSAQAFEPVDGARNYRETLVALPGLGVHYEPLEPAPVEVDWAPLGVDASLPRLICAGTPYKYLPHNDRVLLDIARSLERCQLLFFTDAAPRLSWQLHQRLEMAFSLGGLQANGFLHFLPRQARPAFFGLMRQSDVYLDTIGFSGFNTAMQAVESGLPIVACETSFMRGRFAGGILKTMALGTLVAADESQYVQLVVRLCRDKAFGQEIREQMRMRRGMLLRDPAPIHALETFFEQVSARN